MIPDGTLHLLSAILARAVHDLQHADPLVQEEARQWLMDDPLCAEICEILGYHRTILHRAVGLQASQP